LEKLRDRLERRREWRRVDGYDRGEDPQIGMPKKGGSIFDTPVELLFFARWRPQQCAIAATHQGEAGLN
jgi:hypothetical protein